MSASGGDLPSHVTELIERKKLDELEDVWTRRMEEEPGDLPFFFAIASAVKKKGGGSQAISWLRFLADYQAERGDPDARISVLAEITRLSPGEADARKDLADAIRKHYASHPALADLLAQKPLESAPNPSEVAGRIQRWLRFSPGEIYFMPGRGAGRLLELNPALDVVRLEFGGTKVALSLFSAEKNLLPLPAGHFLRVKVEDPASLKSLAEQDPPEAIRRLLESFGHPMTLAEIKASMSGLVEEAHWPGFWAAARKHPQLLASGGAKSALIRWSASTEEAEKEIRRAFAEAPAAGKIEMARRHGRRSKDLARFFAEGLAAEARKGASGSPGLAWELSQTAAKLAPGEPQAFSSEELLAVKDLPSALTEIGDPNARQKALEAILQNRADWAEIFSQQLLREEDARVLSLLFSHLGERGELREELSRRILREPRLAPRAFLFLCERLREEGKVGPPSLFYTLLDALKREEFGPLKARLKEFFNPGNLAVSLVRAAASEQEARELLAALDRSSALEEHRRGTVREALLMRFPELRSPAREFLYSTPEAIELRRKELLQLKQVALPANAEAMRVAREHGDLTENFEYQAARQRHEYLSARIASLADELSRCRALDPSRIDPSEVRVGTRVGLREVGTGEESFVTILGPWDSRPEESIYSYQSDFAQELLGKRSGDQVRVSGRDAVVVSIEPWR